MLANQLSEDELTPNVNIDLHVMDPHIVTVDNLDMELGRVHELDASDLDILAALHLKESWSACWIVLNELSHPPHKSLTIDLT